MNESIGACPMCGHPLRELLPLVDILSAVAKAHGVSRFDLQSKSRLARYTEPRHLAMWLCRELRPDLSLPQIARVFARDRTTVLYGYHKIDAQMKGLTAQAVWKELYPETTGSIDPLTIP